jgi:hypothetical protein
MDFKDNSEYPKTCKIVVLETDSQLQMQLLLGASPVDWYLSSHLSEAKQGFLSVCFSVQPL